MAVGRRVPRVLAIPLHGQKGQIRAWTLVDEDDYDRANAFVWTLSSDGYAYRQEWREGKQYPIKLHRFLLGLERGDGVEGDHRNGNPLDNRRCNLRTATRAENAQNVVRRGREHLRGVSFHGKTGRWRARCKIGGREYSGGLHDTPEEAARAAAALRAKHLPFAVERHAS